MDGDAKRGELNSAAPILDEPKLRPIGIGAGTTLTGGELAAVVRARKLAKATMRNIRESLFFSFLFDGTGVPTSADVF